MKWMFTLLTSQFLFVVFVYVHLSPQKDMIVQGDVQRAFAVDSFVSSHPLTRGEEEVNKPEEISQMFDTISYSKV